MPIAAAEFKGAPAAKARHEPAASAESTPVTVSSISPGLSSQVNRVLTRYFPAHIIVDSRYELVHLQGHAGRYLELASGGASLNLFGMLREGLERPLRTAFDTAQRRGAAARVDDVQVKLDRGCEETISLEVTPVAADGRDWYIVVFETDAEPAQRHTTRRRQLRPSELEQAMGDQVAELQTALRVATELQERTNGEIKAANEEVQLAYEELQSINEELEVSREELQTSNEDLLALNEVLVTRSAQLSTANRELRMLLANASIAIIVVDTELKIRNFTEAAQRSLDLIATDIGRPLADLQLRLLWPDLLAGLREVIDTGVMKQFDLQDDSGSRYSVRVGPSRDECDEIDGAAIVALDMK